MFIPGLDQSDAHSTTVLTSIRHTQATTGVGTFRTNVGVFNPEDNPANVTFTIFDGGTNQLGSPVTRTVPGHSGLQVSGIFEAAGAASASTENAVIVVAADSDVFSYGVVLDNNTADPIFVVGARGPAPAAHHAGPRHRRRDAHGDAGRRRHADADSGLRRPRPRSTSARAGSTSSWTRQAATTRRRSTWARRCAGIWVDSFHSTTSDTGVWDSGQHGTPNMFDFTFNQAGTFPYHCTVHGTVMNGTVTVNP